MSTNLPPRFRELLAVLKESDVEFIVVGAAAANLGGAPISTTDVDVVIRRGEANVPRILAACEALTAFYVDPAGRRIPPTEDRVRHQKLHLLNTRLGRLDLMISIGPDWDYEALLGRSEVADVGGVEVRLLDLDSIADSKEFANRPKDRSVIGIIREAARLKREKEKLSQ